MDQPHSATPEQLEGSWYRAAASRSVASDAAGIGAAQIQVGPEYGAGQRALLTLAIRGQSIHLNGHIEKDAHAGTYRWRGRLRARLLPRRGWQLLATRERGLIAASSNGSLTFRSGVILFAAAHLSVEQATRLALKCHDQLGLTSRAVEELNWFPAPTDRESTSNAERWARLTSS